MRHQHLPRKGQRLFGLVGSEMSNCDAQQVGLAMSGLRASTGASVAALPAVIALLPAAQSRLILRAVALAIEIGDDLLCCADRGRRRTPVPWAWRRGFRRGLRRSAPPARTWSSKRSCSRQREPQPPELRYCPSTGRGAAMLAVNGVGSRIRRLNDPQCEPSTWRNRLPTPFGNARRRISRFLNRPRQAEAAQRTADENRRIADHGDSK